MRKIQRLKITKQGLLNITSTNEISYNRKAIMQEGWRLKKAGVKDGLAQAWKAARVQMNNLKELIAETEQERAEYIEDYVMAHEVAADLIEDGIEPTEGPMADALYDYTQMINVLNELGFLNPEQEYEALYNQLLNEYIDDNKEPEIQEEPVKITKPMSFAEIQKQRLKKLLGEVA